MLVDGFGMLGGQGRNEMQRRKEETDKLGPTRHQRLCSTQSNFLFKKKFINQGDFIKFMLVD